ncbi:MAG: SCO family protein [Planctomycetes bacterium]|nr:SCO family protein [Planctomycetota bacterium]
MTKGITTQPATVRPSRIAIIGAAIVVGGASSIAQVSPLDVTDPPEGVGIDERLDEQLPLDLQFIDDTGRTVTLGEYFDRGMPVVFTPVFYRCRNLCSATLNGLAEALKEIEWSVGEDFQIVTFTISPKETYRLAEVKKRNYLAVYKRENAADGWHFLTGDEDSIEALTKALGFRYRFVERTGDYAHAASIIVATPQGRLSRYINTVMPESETLGKALIEASQGAIGSPWDRFVLWCSTYDPAAGKYVVAARRVMTLGGLATMLIVVIGLGMLWRHELKIRRHKPALGELQT